MAFSRGLSGLLLMAFKTAEESADDIVQNTTRKCQLNVLPHLIRSIYSLAYLLNVFSRFFAVMYSLTFASVLQYLSSLNFTAVMYWY